MAAGLLDDVVAGLGIEEEGAGSLSRTTEQENRGSVFAKAST